MARGTRRSVPSRRRLQPGKLFDYNTASKIAGAMAATHIAQSAKALYKKSGLGQRRKQGAAAPKSGKKSASTTRTTTMRRRKEEGTGAYNQWSQRYDSKTYGKLTMNKLVKQNIEETIFNYTMMGRFGGQGQYFMGNFLSTAPGYVGDNFLPCIAIDLTSINNVISGSVVPYSPVAQLYKTAGGLTKWFALGGTAPDGSATSTWSVEKSANLVTASSTYPGDQSVLKWAAAELELWGMKNYPTKWVVQLCQFSDDVCPDYANTTTDGNYEEFWDAYTKQYSYNPLAYQKDGYGKKKLKIWRTQAINIDPTASFENDASPHCKTLKLFYRLNRMMKYDWKYRNADGQAIADFQSSKYQQEDAENQNVVHPNARLFLMLRATNFQYQTSGGYPACTSANSPSVSMKVRTCHVINQ